MNAKTILGWRLFLFALIWFVAGESAQATDWFIPYRNDWEHQSSILSPDGSLIAIGAGHGDYTKAIFISKIQPASEPLKVSIPEQSAGHMAISADNKFLAAATYTMRSWEPREFEDHLRIWKLDGLVLIQDTQLEPGEPIGSLRFSPDGSRIYMLTHKSTRVFNLKLRKFTESFDCTGNQYCQADISPDGKWLAAPDFRKTVRLVDIEKKEKEKSLSGETKKGIAVCRFSPDGKHLAGLEIDGQLMVWDIQKAGKPLFAVEHSWGNHFAFSPDSKSIAVVQESDFPEPRIREDEIEYPYQDVMLTVYNVADGKHIAHTPIPRQVGEVTFPYFTPDSKKLFISSMCPEECLIEMNFK